MATYKEINDSFSLKKKSTVKDNTLAITIIYNFIKCYIKKMGLDEYKSLVIINENKIIGFDLNEDFELKELIKLYLAYRSGIYEIKFALGLGKEVIESFIEFTVRIELHNDTSFLSIPNLKSNSYDESHKINIKNIENNAEAYEKIIDKISHQMFMFINYGYIEAYLEQKIIPLTSY